MVRASLRYKILALIDTQIFIFIEAFGSLILKDLSYWSSILLIILIVSYILYRFSRFVDTFPGSPRYKRATCNVLERVFDVRSGVGTAIASVWGEFGQVLGQKGAEKVLFGKEVQNLSLWIIFKHFLNEFTINLSENLAVFFILVLELVWVLNSKPYYLINIYFNKSVKFYKDFRTISYKITDISLIHIWYLQFYIELYLWRIF